MDLRSLSSSTNVTGRQVVEHVFLCINFPEGEPETNARYERHDGESTVVPREERISREGNHSFADGVGNSSHEQRKCLDHRTHVFGCFRKGILERGNRGENLRNGNYDI